MWPAGRLGVLMAGAFSSAFSSAFDTGSPSEFAASAGLSVGGLALSVVAAFTVPSYTVVADISTKSSVSAEATFTQPAYSASASISTKSTLVSAAIFNTSAFTCTVTIVTGSLSVSADATFTATTIEENEQYLGNVVCYTQTIACF